MRPVACRELTQGGGLGSRWSCNVNPISLSSCNELRLWLLTGELLCVKALIEAFKMAHPKEFTIPFTPTHARWEERRGETRWLAYSRVVPTESRAEMYRWRQNDGSERCVRIRLRESESGGGGGVCRFCLCRLCFYVNSTVSTVYGNFISFLRLLQLFHGCLQAVAFSLSFSLFYL